MSPSQIKTAEPKSPNRTLLIVAWIVILCISDLPNVLFNFLGYDPASLPGFKLVLLLICLILSWMIEPLRPLWKFAFVFLVFYLANAGVDGVRTTEFWQSRFEAAGITHVAAYLSFHTLDVIRALLVILAMWLVKRNWADMYLTKGQWDAPIEPVCWLGIGRGESWRVFGWIFTGCAAVAILLPLAFSIPLTAEVFSRALPFLPLAILLAGLNAFPEETYYRASMLSMLADVVGGNQALLMNCVFFGLAHYLAVARRPASSALP